MSGFLLPAYTLWLREMVRFFRQRDRVLGALATPIMFWLLLGLGIGKSFRSANLPEGQGYLEFFYAGTMTMVLLFTAIFSTISIIEDRREGFLQGVLVAPVGRFGLVFGKLLGGTTLALIQGLMFLLLAPFAGVKLDLLAILLAVSAMTIVGVALTGLGFLIAWPMNSTQGFHAIMNLFLVPMWMLSGAVFPASGAPRWVGWIMDINPLTYGVTAIRDGLAGKCSHVGMGVSVGFAVVMVVASLVVSRRTNSGDLL